MSGFWHDLTRDYRRLPAEIREVWQQAREECWELIAEFRQRRQLTRRMWQRVTGIPSPTRRERRSVERAVLAEAAELEAAERRVIAEHEQDNGKP